VHGCSGLYRSKDILVQHTCQHTSAYSYDLIFEKTLSKAKAILQRQDTNEIAATFGTSPRPHVACRAKGRGNSRKIEVYKAVTISPKRRPGALLWGPRAHWGCAVVLDC